MTIIQHNFNNSRIPQTDEDLNLNGNLVPNGYVNATAMCKANGKSWGHYWETKKAKSFAKTVTASVIGITISDKPIDAVVIVQGGEDPTIQGTWVHPNVAIHLAMWISDDFALWATEVLLHVINGNFAALTEEAKEAQREYQKCWDTLREQTVTTRKTLTKSVRDWYARNPGGTTRPIHAMISQVTNLVYQKLWGMDAKQLEDHLSCSRHESRDYLDPVSLRILERAEDNLIEFICEDNLKPVDAVPLANIRSKPLPARQEPIKV